AAGIPGCGAVDRTTAQPGIVFREPGSLARRSDFLDSNIVPVHTGYSGREMRRVWAISTSSDTQELIPRNHQFAGSRLYSWKPGVRITDRAAAIGLIDRAISTVS